MGVVLEIKSGSFAGQKVPVRGGQTLLIGRAPDRAQFAFPNDTHMSGLHFAVECGPSGCRVIDKGSTNGTFLNGAKIHEAMLASGDEIKSGQTIFVVRILPDNQVPATAPSAQAAISVTPDPRAAAVSTPAPSHPPSASPAPTPAPDNTHKVREEPAPLAPMVSKYAPRPVPSPAARAPQQPGIALSSSPIEPPALLIGTWAFSKIPQGWQIQEGLGIRLDSTDDKVFPSNIGAMEEPLGPGITLPQYVEAQTKMFREYLREPQIDAALPPKIPGATETVALEVRYTTKEGPSIYYHRVYARSGSLIGVLTLTTLEKDISSVRPAYDSVLSGISFSPPM